MFDKFSKQCRCRKKRFATPHQFAASPFPRPPVPGILPNFGGAAQNDVPQWDDLQPGITRNPSPDVNNAPYRLIIIDSVLVAIKLTVQKYFDAQTFFYFRGPQFSFAL